MIFSENGKVVAQATPDHLSVITTKGMFYKRIWHHTASEQLHQGSVIFVVWKWITKSDESCFPDITSDQEE